jgi:hypothetical protein
VVSIVVEHGLHGSSTARLVRDLILAYLEFREPVADPEIAIIAN